MYAVKAALQRSSVFDALSEGWKSATKMHFGGVALAEFTGVLAELKMARFGLALLVADMAVFGQLDELRHAAVTTFFGHELVAKDPQYDWTQKAFHTNDWVAISLRNLFDAMMTSANAVAPTSLRCRSATSVRPGRWLIPGRLTRRCRAGVMGRLGEVLDVDRGGGFTEFLQRHPDGVLDVVLLVAVAPAVDMGGGCLADQLRGLGVTLDGLSAPQRVLGPGTVALRRSSLAVILLAAARRGRGGVLPRVTGGLAAAVVLLGALPVVVVLQDDVGGGGEAVPAAVGDRGAERLRFLAHRAERPLTGLLLAGFVEQ